MNEWIVNGMIAGSTALTITGVSTFFLPNKTMLGLASGTVGGIGVAIAAQQQNQRFKKQMRSQIQLQVEQKIQDVLEPKLNAIQQQLSNLEQATQANRQNNISPHPTISLPDPKAELNVDRVNVQTVSQSKSTSTDSTLDNAEIELDDMIELEDMQDAIAWFQARRMEVEKYYHPQPEIDIIFNRLAYQLGKGYKSQDLEFIHRKIKWAIHQNGGRIRLNLLDQDRGKIGYWTNFCSTLHRNSFLSSYRYSRIDKVLQATVQQQGDIIQFLNGGWLERFVFQQILNYLRSKEVDYSYVLNPKVAFPYGSFELDLFFLIEGEPLWIECKTGKEYNRFIKIYSDHRAHLAIPEERALLVILDIPDHEAEALTSLWKLKVINLEGFIRWFP
jgi:hypothetical protein